LGIFGLALYPLVKRAYRDTEYPRGMDFHHDLVDWLGGYPYEYRTKYEISKLIGNEFGLVKIIEPKIPTGNTEFVFAHQYKS
jgi:2-polyprenyl-6-hydroxyphenyl methylase/3-demethylubiquinone-9 3-methyltransferase